MTKTRHRARILTGTLVLLSTSLFAACLYPLGLSDACKTQISECLKDCPQRPPRANDGFANSGDEYLKVVDTCFNGIDQVDNSQGDCDLNDPINAEFSENDFNGDGLVDIGNPGSLDEAWLIQEGYDEQFDNNGLGVWDVDGDMAADPFAWYKDSDDVNGVGDNPNARQAHHDLRADDGQADNGGYSFKNSKYGHYNAYGNYEKGSGNDRSFSDELKEIIYNTGFEWQYSETFIMRLGFIYDIEGDIKNPTFGAGLNFDKYGFDFGYTHGDDSDSRAETMYFSISLLYTWR